MADLDLVAQIGGANHGLAIVSVVRPDDSIHSSLVNAGVLDHPVTGNRVVGCVLGGATRKLAYLEVLREGMRAHLASFQTYPPKRVMGLRART